MDQPRPSPRHEQVAELMALAHDTSARIATALDHPFQIMASGDAWTGPAAATIFTEDIGHRREHLPAIADNLVADIGDELSATPQLLG